MPLPFTSPALLRDDERPYFVWWLDATTADFRKGLHAPDPARRAYWMGLLLRAANTRDVWAFVTPAEIREHWPLLQRHLGRTRSMWAWLLGLADCPWPPAESRHAPSL